MGLVMKIKQRMYPENQWNKNVINPDRKVIEDYIEGLPVIKRKIDKRNPIQENLKFWESGGYYIPEKISDLALTTLRRSGALDYTRNYLLKKEKLESELKELSRELLVALDSKDIGEVTFVPSIKHCEKLSSILNFGKKPLVEVTDELAQEPTYFPDSKKMQEEIKNLKNALKQSPDKVIEHIFTLPTSASKRKRQDGIELSFEKHDLSPSLPNELMPLVKKQLPKVKAFLKDGVQDHKNKRVHN